MRTNAAAVIALAALASAPLLAQDAEPAPEVQAHDLLKAAYSLRRLGKLDAAAATFESALDSMPRGPDKRVVAEDLVDLFRCMSPPRLDRALHLYRKNHDVPGEFSILFETNKVDEALAVARLLKYPKGEALALAKLGKVQEAVALLDQKQLPREKAEVLAAAKRHADAANAYFILQDFYAQAEQLELARNAQGARRAFEDARTTLVETVREANDTVQRGQRAYEGAQGGVRREQARARLAKAFAASAAAYERLALVYSRTGQPSDKTAKLAENAAKLLEKQRETLLDRGTAGGDKFGEAMAASLKLDEKIAQLQQKAREYAAAAPAPPPQPPQPPRRGR